MLSEVAHLSEPFPARGFGFHEESYSAHEEESYHSEAEFHSSDASSGGVKFFKPSKFQTMPGHDAAGWNNSNKFNHGSSMNHLSGGWNGPDAQCLSPKQHMKHQNGSWNGHDAHRFDQNHGLKHQNGGWNGVHDAHRFDQNHGLKHQNSGWNGGHDAHHFDQGHGMKHQNGGWNRGHDAHRFDQGHGTKHQNGGWNGGHDAHIFDQGHGMKHQNGSWNNGHHLDHQHSSGGSFKPFYHGSESSGGMMIGKYGTPAVAAAYHKVQYPAAHSVIHEEEAMTAFNGGYRFSGFNDSFGGGGYGRHSGCSNAEWMSKAI